MRRAVGLIALAVAAVTAIAGASGCTPGSSRPASGPSVSDSAAGPLASGPLASGPLASSEPVPGPSVSEPGPGAHRAEDHPSLGYGVTLDDVGHLGQIIASLRRLPARPSVRVVFDPGVPASGYRTAVDRLSQVAGILAEPVDSSAAASYTTAQYAERFRHYVAAFGAKVAVWEVGNEVNGDWLGPAARVSGDIAAAYRVVRQAGGHTALTFSYEPGCAAGPANDMFTWATANVPAAMRQGLDYVLVSYYADDCNGYRPGVQEWNRVFARLHAMFPHARLGFGEVGTHAGDPLPVKVATLDQYYRMRVNVPGYIGGCFWWYYAEDMLPHPHNPLWRALSAAIRPEP